MGFKDILAALEAGTLTRPYSNDLLERVVCAHLDGGPSRAMATRFGVGVSSEPKGYRLKGFAPHGRWRTPTFLASLATVSARHWHCD